LSAVTTVSILTSAQAVTLTSYQAEDAISGKNNNSFFGTGFSAVGENEVGSQRSGNSDPTNNRAARTFVEFQLTAGLIAEAQAALGQSQRLQLSFTLNQVVNGTGKLEGLDIRYFGITASDRDANTLWNTGQVETAQNVIYATTTPGTYAGSFSNAKVISDIASAAPGQVIAFGLVTDLGVDNSVVVGNNTSRQVYILAEAPATYTLALSSKLELVTPTAITQTAGNTLAGFSVANLINNSGFASTPTVADFTSVAYSDVNSQWVTATGVFPSNYFAAGQVAPQFTLALGKSFSLSDLVVWGYGGNANEASDFRLEFSTDGGASFYAQKVVQTSFLLGNGNAVLSLGGIFDADFVRITMINNAGGRGFGGVGPGDRVGLGEIKFLAVSAAVPEPATMGLLALGAMGLLARRARRA
jgi:hypothetical protein